VRLSKKRSATWEEEEGNEERKNILEEEKKRERREGWSCPMWNTGSGRLPRVRLDRQRSAALNKHQQGHPLVDACVWCHCTVHGTFYETAVLLLGKEGEGALTYRCEQARLPESGHARARRSWHPLGTQGRQHLMGKEG